MKHLTILACLALASSLIFTSCDEEEETTYDYLDGAASINALPAYVAPGDTFTFVASGVSIPSDAPAGLELVCKFKTSLDSAYAAVEDLTFTVVIPDTIGSFSVSCNFSAEGYYGSSISTYTSILKDKSLSKLVRMPGGTTFTDSRDSHEYYIADIGGTDWMRSNLTYGGLAFENSPASQKLLGSFYTWSEAKTACPDGWHLPQCGDFEKFTQNAGSYMFNAYLNGEQMWEGEGWPSVVISDNCLFSAIPLGYASVYEGKGTFSGYGQYAVFWASGSEGTPCAYYLRDDGTQITKWTGMAADFAANVRCVRTVEP